MFGTGFGAVHTADALAAVGRLDGVDAHLACFCTLSAVDAFALVDGYVIEADFVKQAVYCSERAEHLAEKPSDEQTSHYD